MKLIIMKIMYLTTLRSPLGKPGLSFIKKIKKEKRIENPSELFPWSWAALLTA